MKKMIIELLFTFSLITGGASCNSDEAPVMPIENKQYKVLPHTTSMEVRWKDAAGVVRFCVEYAEDRWTPCRESKSKRLRLMF